MGRKKLTEPVRVDLLMEKKTVDHLQGLANDSGIRGGKSQLIRDAVDKVYPIDSDETIPVAKPIPVNVKRAFSIIHLMEILCSGQNATFLHLPLTKVSALMDIPYSRMNTVVNMAHEFLEAKGWTPVVEILDNTVKIPGRPGRPIVTHMGWKMHAHGKPFSEVDLNEARMQLTREFETLGYAVRLGIEDEDEET